MVGAKGCHCAVVKMNILLDVWAGRQEREMEVPVPSIYHYR